jgi:hypothetical protein
VWAANPPEPGGFLLGDELISGASRANLPEGTVECYSGYEYAQRPRAFVWQGERFEVAQIDAEWRTPEGKSFRVRAPDGQVFDLFYRAMYDQWDIHPG